MLCKCHWIVLLYCACYSVLFRGAVFSGHSVNAHLALSDERIDINIVLHVSLSTQLQFIKNSSQRAKRNTGE